MSGNLEFFLIGCKYVRLHLLGIKIREDTGIVYTSDKNKTKHTKLKKRLKSHGGGNFVAWLCTENLPCDWRFWRICLGIGCNKSCNGCLWLLLLFHRFKSFFLSEHDPNHLQFFSRERVHGMQTQQNGQTLNSMGQKGTKDNTQRKEKYDKS